MRTARNTIITLLLSIYASQVCAIEPNYISVEKYIQLKAESAKTADIYLSGVLTSFATANALLEKRSQKKMYCVPNGVSANKENINGIINLATNITTEIKKTERLKASVASFILWSLIEAYPCK